MQLDRKIPRARHLLHRVGGDDGKLQTSRDVYGHEKRIVLAIEGRWKEIVQDAEPPRAYRDT